MSVKKECYFQQTLRICPKKSSQHSANEERRENMAEIGSFDDRRFWPGSAIETHSLDGLTSSSRTRKRTSCRMSVAEEMLSRLASHAPRIPGGVAHMEPK